MAIFDGRLISPTEAELVAVLRRAMNTANRENRYYMNRMERDTPFWSRFAQDVLRAGPEGRRRSCKGGRAVPEVIAGWWTDPAGRKHIRIIGRTRMARSGLRGEVEMRSLPPWWHVYPEAILGVRGKKEGERYLAVCRCGAIGTPETLGWMGDTCGPCFDRRMEGGTTAGGFGQFGGWSSHLTRFCFTADGRHLIGQNHSNTFWKLNREDGTTTTTKRRSYNAICSTVSNNDGTTIATQDGSVFRWHTSTDDIRLILGMRQTWGRITLSPDGSRVVLVDFQNAHTADLTAAKPKYTPLNLMGGMGYSTIQFLPDGSRVLAMNFAGELRAVNPTTLGWEIIHRDVFDGAPIGYGAPGEMALARDGSGVLVSRQRAAPYYIMVRHVPLGEGKAVMLNIPGWHRPTALAYSPDNRYAITAEGEGGWVGFFDVTNGRAIGFVRAVMEDIGWRGGHIEFTADGRALAVSYTATRYNHGSTIAIWPWPDVLQAAELVGSGQ